MLLSLCDITKTYVLGEVLLPVLRGISLDVDAGEYVALMGASGSGKSTLMNILGCLDRPTTGSYHLESRDLSKASANERAQLRSRKIGFVFQSFNLLRRTSALDNVLMPLTYSPEPIDETQARARALELLGMVGLSDRVHHEPSQLSGGQQQRVAIARALINHPSLLLADEPTGNLDSRTANDVMKLFEMLHRERGLTIVLVTHESRVASHTQRVIRLEDGEICGEGL